MNFWGAENSGEKTISARPEGFSQKNFTVCTKLHWATGDIFSVAHRKLGRVLLPSNRFLAGKIGQSKPGFWALKTAALTIPLLTDPRGRGWVTFHSEKNQSVTPRKKANQSIPLPTLGGGSAGSPAMSVTFWSPTFGPKRGLYGLFL